MLRWIIIALAALTVAGDSGSATVGHSTLAINCGSPVQVDWYVPSTTPTGVVLVQHGYGGSKSDVAGFAQDLAAKTNSLVVAPTITSSKTDQCWLGSVALERAVAALFTGDRAALTASARAAGFTSTMPQKFVLMGHSLGGNLALTAGSYASANPDLKSVILLDGGSLDLGSDQAAAALSALAGKPVLDVASPPSTPCKVGDLAPVLTSGRPSQFVGVWLVNGLHLDALGWSLASLLCGFSRVENVAAVQTIADGWVTDAFTGSSSGLTGTSGQRITVGAATAVVF